MLAAVLEVARSYKKKHEEFSQIGKQVHTSTQIHRTIELLRLEITFKIIESNP